VDVTRSVCEEFKANAGGSTLEYVSKHHALSKEDAKEWLDGTEWACKLEVEEQTLKKTQEALIAIGQIKELSPSSAIVHPELCNLLPA